jgi:hypothetical protein
MVARRFTEMGEAKRSSGTKQASGVLDVYFFRITMKISVFFLILVVEELTNPAYHTRK